MLFDEWNFAGRLSESLSSFASVVDRSYDTLTSLDNI